MEIKKIPNQIIKNKLQPLNLKNVDAIAFHHTASTSWGVKDVEFYHVNTNGWNAIGYNYFIAFDGTVYEGRGLNVGAGVSGNNSHIISVCMQGNFETQYPCEEQYESGREIVAYLREKIPSITKIGMHKDWNATACPGKNFDIKKILKEEETVTEEIKELTTVNDIVWELSVRNIITDKALWLKKLEEDKNAYWLARKCLNAIRGIK